MTTAKIRTAVLSAATILGVGAVTAVAVQPGAEQDVSTVSFGTLGERGTTVGSIPAQGRSVLTAMGRQMQSLGGDVAENGRALAAGNGSVHELSIPTGGRLFLVINGDHGCFVEDGLPSPAAGCARTRDLTDARRLVTSITKESDSAWRVVSLVPDGTRAALVRDEAGHAAALQAAGNVGVARVQEIPESISWTDAHGSAHNQTVGGDARQPR